MTFALGRPRRRLDHDDLQAEAAAVIAERVASGRPPAEVWRRAEEWRAANPRETPGWYAPQSDARPPVPTVSPHLLPRAVRVPAVSRGGQHAGANRRPARVPKTVR